MPGLLGQALPDALALADRAVTLNPNSAYCWDRSGWVRTYVGHSEMAVEHFERAARLVHWIPPLTIGCPAKPSHYCSSDDLTKPLLSLQALRLNPAYTTPFRPLAAALAHMGGWTRLKPSHTVFCRLNRVSRFRHGATGRGLPKRQKLSWWKECVERVSRNDYRSRPHRLLAVALVVTAELLARYAAEHATRRSREAPSAADMSSAQLFGHS